MNLQLSKLIKFKKQKTKNYHPFCKKNFKNIYILSQLRANNNPPSKRAYVDKNSYR